MCKKALSNEKIDDIDIATILTTDQIKEKFKDTNLKVIDSELNTELLLLCPKTIKLN